MALQTPREAGKRTVAAGLAIALLFVYLASYGFILPVAEVFGVGKLAYFLYTPVEFLRFRSDPLWNFSEYIYKGCTGVVQPRNRFAIHGKRRELTRHNDGATFEEVQYLDGKPIRSTWRDRNGQVLAEGTWQDGTRWDGSFIFYDGGGLAEYRFFVDHYTMGRLMSRVRIDGSQIDIGYYMDEKLLRRWWSEDLINAAIALAMMLSPVCVIWKSLRRRKTTTTDGTYKLVTIGTPLAASLMVLGFIAVWMSPIAHAGMIYWLATIGNLLAIGYVTLLSGCILALETKTLLSICMNSIPLALILISCACASILALLSAVGVSAGILAMVFK